MGHEPRPAIVDEAAGPDAPVERTELRADAAPQPPGSRTLFVRHAPPSPDADLRHLWMRAVQGGYAEWQRCYEPVLCTDAEPPSVAIELTIGPDGHVREARALSVTRFVQEGDDVLERSGEVDAALPRCLADFVLGLSLRWQGDSARTLHHRFRPETAGCPP